MKYFARRLLLALLVLAITSGMTVAQTRVGSRRPRPKAVIPAPAATALPPAALKRVEAFNKVWTTINDFYYDATFSNLDWNAIKTEFEPRVRAAKTDAELYKLLNEMIGRLKRSHLAIITPEIYQAIERAKVEAKAREAAQAAEMEDADESQTANGAAAPDGEQATQFGIGLDLRIINNQFVITRVSRNSAAEAAGLKPGFVIDRINGVSLTLLLRRIQLQNIDSARVIKYLPFEIIGSFLNGERDSTVSLTYLDAANNAVTANVKRQPLAARTISLGRNLPDRQLEFEARSLNDDVGYIRFNYFAVAVIDQFCDAISAFKNKKALIVDLRGNLGGILASMVGLAGMLTDTSIDLGTSIYKTGSESLEAVSKKKRFLGKVVILVDNQTVSAAEIFSAALQDAGRAIVVGVTTSGEALPSVALDLPTGAALLFPIANFRTPSGRYLEGQGVQPDIFAPLSRAALLSGKDDQLDVALQTIISGRSPVARKPATDAGSVSVTAKVGRPPPPPPPRRISSVKTTSKLTVVGQPVATLPPDGLGRAEDDATPPATEKPDIKDEQSKKIIAEFLDSIGGADRVRKITSYALKGTGDVFVKGTQNAFEYESYFQSPNFYTEILRSAAAGEVREVHNATENFVQSDYGLTAQLPAYANTGDRDLLAPIRTLADDSFYVSLQYKGTYDADGRQVSIIDAKTKDGYYLALGFDAQTKELIRFTGSFYLLTLSDYQKVGDIRLPFKIKRGDTMTVTIDEAKVNTAIDPANFSRKLNCFDGEN